MLAVTASFDMTAQDGRAANLDSAHRLELLKRKRVVVAVRVAVLAEDAGQLEAGPGHASGFEFARAAWLANLRQGIQRRGSGCYDLLRHRRVMRRCVDALVSKQ